MRQLFETSFQMSLPPKHRGQDMSGTYEIEWRPLFKSLTWFLSVAIIGGSVGIMAIRLVSLKFDMAKAFQHVSPLVFVLLMLGTPFFSALVAFLIALWVRMARITIADGTIQGVNFWGRRKKIPLGCVTKLVPFHNNGIHATIVDSKHHGQVFISNHTRDVSALLDFLNSTLAENERLLGGAAGRS